MVIIALEGLNESSKSDEAKDIIDDGLEAVNISIEALNDAKEVQDAVDNTKLAKP